MPSRSKSAADLRQVPATSEPVRLRRMERPVGAVRVDGHRQTLDPRSPPATHVRMRGRRFTRP